MPLEPQLALEQVAAQEEVIEDVCEEITSEDLISSEYDSEDDDEQLETHEEQLEFEEMKQEEEVAITTTLEANGEEEINLKELLGCDFEIDLIQAEK